MRLGQKYFEPAALACHVQTLLLVGGGDVESARGELQCPDAAHPAVFSESVAEVDDVGRRYFVCRIVVRAVRNIVCIIQRIVAAAVTQVQGFYPSVNVSLYIDIRIAVVYLHQLFPLCHLCGVFVWIRTHLQQVVDVTEIAVVV